MEILLTNSSNSCPHIQVQTVEKEVSLCDRRPVKVTYQMLKGTLKSCLFLSTYIAAFRYGLCIFKNFRYKVDCKNYDVKDGM